MCRGHTFVLPVAQNAAVQAGLFQFNSLILKPKMAVCATLIQPSHGDTDKLPDHTTPLILPKSPLVANILPKIAPSPNDKS